MNSRIIRATLLAGVALSFGATAAMAQQTPGDQSGTATPAGGGQSAATPTNAPAPARVRDDSNPSDIIVTARRVEERLQDVPISITVFNQQQLANRNVVNSQDLATYTPSLSANSNFGAQNAAFAIRGFTQEIGTQPSVGVYFADVVSPRGAANNIPIGDGAGPGDFFDLQNVQVLKGPQGTLFGRNTTGGAILLVPQKPTSKFEGYVEGSYGNYDMKRIQGVINVPLSDVARLRVAVDHESRDGYAKNDAGSSPSRFYDINYTAARASLVVDLTPDLENYTIASYLRSDTNGDDQKLVGCLPNNSPGVTGPLPLAFLNLLGSLACAQLAREQAKGAGFLDVQAAPSLNPNTLLTTWRLINTTTWHATDSLTVKNIVSYAELREVYRSPIFGTSFNLADAATAPFFGIPAGSNFPLFFAASSNIPNRNSAGERTFTEEFQLQGKGMGDRLTWQAGGYLELADPLALTGAQSPVLLNCADLANFVCANPVPNPSTPGLGAGDINYTANKTRFRNHGIYAQATYAITDQLKVTGGIRYTWDRSSAFNILRSYEFTNSTAQTKSVGYKCNDPTVDPTPGVLHPISDQNTCANTITARSQKPTWLIDVDYKPTDDILLYAKYARGYRAGGVQPQAPNKSASQPIDLRTFAPEKVDSYEAGIKTSFRGAVRGTLNIAGFYNNLSNQQLLVSLVAPPNSGLGPASGALNIGKSRIWGIEVEGSIQPFEGLSIDGGYSYINSKLVTVPPFVSSCTGTVYCAQFYGLKGDPEPLTPKNKFTITTTYTLPLDPSIGKIAIGATFTHFDKQLSNYIDKYPTVTVGGAPFVDTAPTPANIRALSTLPSRNLLNLNLNWTSVAGSPVDVSLFATNVTNKHYLSYVAGLFQATQFETAELGEPRMFGGRIKVHFGR